jgi:hypothetical protein
VHLNCLFKVLVQNFKPFLPAPCSPTVSTSNLDDEQLMPVILRIKGYRFWFYESDLEEPPHIHVGKDGKEAKFWVNPITLAKSRRFRDYELNEIEKIIQEFQDNILNAWQKEKEKRGNS